MDSQERMQSWWWGALRGAIGLALALVIANDHLHVGNYSGPNPIPETIRDQFLFFVSGIVLLTLLVNATTVKLVVNGLGLTKIPAVKALMMGQAAQTVERSAENEMDLLKNDRFLSGASWGRVRNYLPEMDVPHVSEAEKANIDTLAEARRRLLEKEKPATGTNLVLGYLDLRRSMLSLVMLVKFLILTALLHLRRETTLRMFVAPPHSWEFRWMHCKEFLCSAATSTIASQLHMMQQRDLLLLKTK